jgi:hypothetical protein
VTEDLVRYGLALQPDRPITISFEVAPSDVELALATNAASLRSATLMALLAALVADDAADAASSADALLRRPSPRS